MVRLEKKKKNARKRVRSKSTFPSIFPRSPLLRVEEQTSQGANLFSLISWKVRFFHHFPQWYLTAILGQIYLISHLNLSSLCRERFFFFSSKYPRILNRCSKAAISSYDLPRMRNIESSPSSLYPELCSVLRLGYTVCILFSGNR